MFRVDGDELRPAAVHGAIGAVSNAISPGFVSGRAVLERRTIHVEDLAVAVATDFTDAAEHQRRFGHRTTLATPLLREGVPIGAITIRRLEVRPFTGGQVRLLETFAAQAVIAIENVRLFQELQARNRELTESLEQQTATAEILQVISSSPTDLAPVMEAVTRNAARLARADHALIGEAADGRIRWLATAGCPLVSDGPPISRQLPSGRAILDCQTTQVEDVAELTEDFPGVRRAHHEQGVRTILATPLVREGLAIGVLLVRRTEVRPFAGKEIELLRTFADQAVIAIENVRLFKELEARNRELTESLEQQTATAEILRVISSSPTDVQPVFDTIVESVARLCDGVFTTAFRFDGELIHPVAYHRNVGLAAQEVHERMYPRSPSADSVVARAILDRAVVHVLDVESDVDVPAATRELAQAAGYRSILAVPMLREGNPIGALGMGRRELNGRPRPFSAREIALVQTFADQAVIAIENVRLFKELQARNRELTESLEQQTATGAILRVMSASPTDIQPVLDAVAESATRLCDAKDVSIALVDQGVLRVGASHGVLARWWPDEGIPIDRGSVTGRAVVDRQAVHIHDLASEPDEEFPQGKAYQRLGGHRTNLAVPLLKEGVAVGVIGIRRGEVRPFTDRQVGLLKTFADQAVIAIENVRLFKELEARNRELTESLAQQTATGEILRVISGSPTDVQPVFEVIVENAMRLCDGLFSTVHRVEGSRARLVAHRNVPDSALQAAEYLVIGPGEPDSVTARTIRERAVVHVPDIEHDPGVPARSREVARLGGHRCIVEVPMLLDGHPVGTISVARREARAFSDEQIALLQTFAAQAVIAVENVRLFQELEARNRELTEALEQQTATAEILRVISSSPTGVEPVFKAIARSATTLCEADLSGLYTFDGELIHIGSLYGRTPEETRANQEAFPHPPGRLSVAARAILAAAAVQVPDVSEDSEYAATLRSIFRTVLAVPMIRDGRPIGAISVARRVVRPFTHKQSALLQTFAEQAVIAIENVRLFTELEARNRELTESLEQQTATAEILRVISSSPTDVHPVFDAIAVNAAQVCEAGNANVYRFDGSLIHLVASHGYTVEELSAVKEIFPIPPGRGGSTARAVATGAIVHIPDVSADPEYAYAALVQAGFRTNLSVPLLRDGKPIGAITVARRETRPFSDRQIAMLQTFAAQAVIAVENVRLFTELGARNRELTESLERQTATGEILRVISSSPTDIQPVFDAIVRSAVPLCEAANGSVFRFDGRLIHLEAHRGFTPEALRAFLPMFPRAPGRGSVAGRTVLTRSVVHVDITKDLEYEHPENVQAGFRTLLGVPMLREGNPIGVIVVTREEGAPFSDTQIALLETFADQAVIAIENVRLFTELGARNRELTESLEQQTATSEILRAISASPTDTQPVFDTIAQRAVRVCDGTHCAVMRFDGTLVDVVAHAGMSVESVGELRRVYPLPLTADTLAVRSIREGKVIHSADMLSDPSEPVRRLAQVGRYRSGIMVPMLRSGSAVGVISVGRSDPAGGPRPFTEKEIVLLQTFADQGVIAVENVRLFRELEARTGELARSVEELQALSDVGRAVSSTLDLPTVLATIVARAVQLSGTSGGGIYEYDEATQEFHLKASHRTEEELVEVLRARPVRLGEGATGLTGLRRVPVEIADTLEDQQYQVTPLLRSTLNKLGYRSILGVPLLLESRILGALTVWRREPGSFPPDTVKLMQTFATQSALAIQNARLFREIEAKSRELEVASRHKSRFLANMSHELRTPLNAILGYTELLVDGIYGDLSPKAGDVMTRIDRSGKHLLGLINDVLDLSKIEAGQLELGLADYSLTEVVNTVVTQVEALAAEKGLILQAAVAPDLPAGRGDERRLAQVLLNLVGNAIKFTEVGSVRVAAYREGDAFVVSVADTGPGIAEADRQRIFEEFQQADSSTTRKKGGTGLGLSIAKRIVELHGGQFWVDSAVGRGSTFSFRVPVRVDRQATRT